MIFPLTAEETFFANRSTAGSLGETKAAALLVSSRSRLDSDRRVVCLRLSRLGEARVESILRTRRLLMAQALRAFSKPSAVRLAGALARLLSAFEDLQARETPAGRRGAASPRSRAFGGASPAGA